MKYLFMYKFFIIQNNYQLTLLIENHGFNLFIG